MPAADRKLRVFLCHSSHDKPAVRELYKKLQAEAWVDPWLDEEKLLPGQDWEFEIEKALDNSDAVIVTLSHDSVTKEGYVQRELRFVIDIALEKPEGTIFILPLRLEECEPPRKLRIYHYADYFPTERREWAYNRLVASLKVRAGELAQRDQIINSTVEIDQGKTEELARLELEERIRGETETRVRAEYETREKARQATEAKPQPVGRIGNPTHGDRLTLNGNVPGLLGMEFCRVPSGKFLMGSAENDKGARDDEKPQHTVEMPYDYWLARFPVTNEQYAGYVKAAGLKHPVSEWQKKPDHPVTMVSWEYASAYCQWLNDLLTGQLPPKYLLRLPTEAEWEKASRGTDGRIYPWGNQAPDKNLCNFNRNQGGTTPVGKYSPQGDSLYGCADLSGNVWEWTHSLKRLYPYQPEDGREAEKARGGRVLRGGTWALNDRNARCANRYDYPIANPLNNGGFRVVASPALL